MATEYGGTYGDQPWRDVPPPYPDQRGHGDQAAYRPRLPGYGDQPGDGPPSGGYGAGSPGAGSQGGGSQGHGSQGGGSQGGGSRGGRRRARRRARRGFLLAVAVLVVGVVSLVFSLLGVVAQLLPRQFTAGQQRQITNWEYGKRWRELDAGQIFPAEVRYAPPAALAADRSLGLTARRIGIARQTTCQAATDPAAAAVLDRDGCTAMLRATYVNGTDSYVITVGTAILPGAARAQAAARELAAASRATGNAAAGSSAGRGVRIAPGVRAVSFKNTPAAWFTNARRQLSGSIAAGTYVVLYTVGYADSRPREPVAGDKYADGEMTSAGVGVARKVLSVLAAPVPAPRCPGTQGC